MMRIKHTTIAMMLVVAAGGIMNAGTAWADDWDPRPRLRVWSQGRTTFFDCTGNAAPPNEVAIPGYARVSVAKDYATPPQFPNGVNPGSRVDTVTTEAQLVNNVRQPRKFGFEGNAAGQIPVGAANGTYKIDGTRISSVLKDLRLNAAGVPNPTLWADLVVTATTNVNAAPACAGGRFRVSCKAGAGGTWAPLGNPQAPVEEFMYANVPANGPKPAYLSGQARFGFGNITKNNGVGGLPPTVSVGFAMATGCVPGTSRPTAPPPAKVEGLAEIIPNGTDDLTTVALVGVPGSACLSPDTFGVSFCAVPNDLTDDPTDVTTLGCVHFGSDGKPSGGNLTTTDLYDSNWVCVDVTAYGDDTAYTGETIDVIQADATGSTDLGTTDLAAKTAPTAVTTSTLVSFNANSTGDTGVVPQTF
jgi:hypothetical protein